MKLTLSYIILLLASVNLPAKFSAQDSLRIQSFNKTIHSNSASEEQILDAYLQLSILFEEVDLKKSLAFADSAETFLYRSNRRDLLPQVFGLRGLFHSKAGHYLKALQEYQRGIENYADKDSTTTHSGYMHIDIGNIFYQLRQYQDAINFYKKARQIFLHKDEAPSLIGRAVALNNIGLCLLELNQFDTALHCFTRALEIRTKLGDASLVTHSYTHLVEAYLKFNKLREADSIASYAFQSKKLDHSSIWFRQLKLQYANLLILQNKPKKARQKILEVDSVSFGNSQFFFDPYILQTKARYEIAIGNYAKAKSLVDSGFGIALHEKNYRAALAFSSIGKDISLKQNDIESGLAYSESMLHIRDSMIILSEGVVSELLEMNVAFAKTQEQNRNLKNTSANYETTIKGQTWMLIAALLVIIVLVFLFWYINRLSRKQKKSQENQRELNQRILAVVNNTDSHILSLNSDGMIRLINQSAIEFIKTWIKVDVRAGENLLDKITDAEEKKRWMRWFEKSKNINGWKEVSQLTLKGKVYYYLENFSAITRENGKYAGLVMVGHDITKEHEFSVELSQQRDTLEKSNKAKEKMLSILAHDLKDAIYSARSLAEMVTETPEQFPKDELVHLFGLLYNNFDRTKNLLDGLLEWMKTQTGAMVAHPKEFKLKELFDEVMKDCEEKAHTKCISISLDVDPGMKVVADRSMIRTVLRNLVNNSIKYTKPDVGKIIIQGQKVKDKVEIHVKDNGTGIPDGLQPKLFQHGGRFSTPGTKNEVGTGFGLSLCNELLRLNNTSLLLKSKENEGSDFYFSLSTVNKKESMLKHHH